MKKKSSKELSPTMLDSNGAISPQERQQVIDALRLI